MFEEHRNYLDPHNINPGSPDLSVPAFAMGYRKECYEKPLA